MLVLCEDMLDLAVGAVASGRMTAPSEPAGSSFDLVGRPVAGIRVTQETALTYSVFFDCVKIISETLAQLPWHVFRSAGRYRFREPKEAADVLLSRKANPEMGARTAKEVLAIWMLLRGNGYAEIERAGNGDPLALWPLNSASVTPKRDESGALIYEVRQGREEPKILPAERMFHLRGPSPDGIVGWSIVKLARESISLGLAMEAFGASFFGNGCWPGLALEHPGKPKFEARKKMREELTAQHGGAKKARGPLILWEGMKLETFSITPEDSQFLESRVHQVREVCRWFRMSPSKVSDPAGGTKATIEAENVGFITDTIMPWVSRMEEEANMKLLPAKRPELATKMNVNQFMRGDMKTRGVFYKIMFSLGAYSPNDILSLEDRNPIGPAGDMHFVPMNLVSIDQAYKDGNTGAKKAVPGGVSNTSEALVGVVNNMLELLQRGDSSGGSKAAEVAVEQYREAHFGIFESAAKWLVGKEGKAHVRAGKRYAGDVAGFEAWQEGFYRKHADEMVEAFGAPVDALCSLLSVTARTNDDVRAVHKQLTATCEQESAAARKAYSIAYGNLEVSECCRQREEEAPTRIAQAVMESIVQEVLPSEA